MSVTTFQELMQRPNQVKANNNIQTKFSPEQLKEALHNNNISFLMSQKNDQGVEMMSFHALDINEYQFGIQMIIANGMARFQFQAPHPSISPLIWQAISFINNFATN